MAIRYLPYTLIILFLVNMVLGCQSIKEGTKGQEGISKEGKTVKRKRIENNIEYHFSNGIRLINEGEYEKAGEAFSNVIKIDDMHDEALAYRGYVLLKINNCPG